MRHRPRRNRRTPRIRDLVRETRLAPQDFVYPLFVVHGTGVRREIPSMPGIDHLSVDTLVKEVAAAEAEGICGVILFGIPAVKDALGTENFDDDGIVQRAIRAVKAAHPKVAVMTDVCLCEYTDHGHCGVVTPEGQIDNDATLPVLGRVAVSHAAAGADLVAPSGMMDGMVGAIRTALDDNGFETVGIVSYAAKYASAFYGPFRDAAESSPQFGDRRSYQMDPGNRREALRELGLDAEAGADMLMVKPALTYLDVIAEARRRFDLPVAAYNVSGEYAMIKAAAGNGWLDERAAVLESLLGIRRAGADIILTYWARQAARWLADMAD